MLTSPGDTPSAVIQAAKTLRQAWTAAGLQTSPHTAVILGSGLRRIAHDALLSGAVAVPYASVPGMPVTRVRGHHGQFVAGGKQLAGTVLLQGRSHIYEGWTPTEATYSVRLLAELGVRTLIITNAAGGISPIMRPGDLMTITDHLSFVDISVLQQVNSASGRFNREPRVWSQRLLDTAKRLTTPLRVHSGCYAMMSGPNYETPAEIRMLKTLGADAVGMSTVPEGIVGRQLGMDVLGISCITNAAAGLSDGPLSHQEVSDTAFRVEKDFVDWLHKLLAAVVDTTCE